MREPQPADDHISKEQFIAWLKYKGYHSLAKEAEWIKVLNGVLITTVEPTREQKMAALEGGEHLAIVRSWMQQRAINGSQVTWGTDDPLQFHGMITVLDLEFLAQRIFNASLKEALVISSNALRNTITKLNSKMAGLHI